MVEPVPQAADRLRARCFAAPAGWHIVLGHGMEVYALFMALRNTWHPCGARNSLNTKVRPPSPCSISAPASSAASRATRTRSAIVDGGVRFTYAEWYRRISALVAGFDALKLKPGDHLVTVLQNNWQAATIHWACQFAGIIITPLNWRCTADELDYCLDECRGQGAGLRGGVGGGREGLEARQARCRASRWGLPRDDTFETLVGVRRRRRAAAGRRRGLVGDALYVRHHRQAQGRAAPAARRTGRGAGPGGAEPLPLGRAHARRDAALSHHGRALAARRCR